MCVPFQHGLGECCEAVRKRDVDGDLFLVSTISGLSFDPILIQFGVWNRIVPCFSARNILLLVGGDERITLKWALHECFVRMLTLSICSVPVPDSGIFFHNQSTQHAGKSH